MITSIVQSPALLLTLFALVVHVIPGLAGALQWTRGDDGLVQLWTGHLTHWTAEHLFWDALMLAVLGVLAQQRFRLKVGWTFLYAAPLITLGVAHWSPELTSYRGLSGFDTLLFVFVGVRLLCDAKQTGGLRLASALLLLGLVGKTFYEEATGNAIFAQDMGAGVVAAPVAHWVGGGLGLVIGLWPTVQAYFRRRRMARPNAIVAKISA